MSRSPSRRGTRPLLILGALLLFWGLLAAPARAEFFDIPRFAVAIEVAPDASVRVTEIIEAHFFSPRRGIYRSIPLEFAGSRVRIRDVHVIGHPYQVERSRSQADIRIGDPDRTVDGTVVYEISYTLVPPPLLENQEERFYLNIIGPGWQVPIHEAEFRVRMPAPADFTRLRVTAGPVGSEDTGRVEVTWDEHGFAGRSLVPLAPDEAITVFLPLPAGYYTEARTPGPLPGILLAAFSVVLLLLAWVLWHTKGRDPHLIVTPEFYPPNDMTPAEAGYIIDRVVDDIDITSLILYWASRGYLTLEELPKDHFRITRIRDLPANQAKPFEPPLFRALFAHGDGTVVETSALAGSFHEEMTTAREMITAWFRKDPDRRIYCRDSIRLSVLSTGLSLVPLWALGTLALYTAEGYVFHPVLAGLGLLVALLPFAGVTLLVRTLTRWRYLPRRRSLLQAAGSVLLLLLGLLILLAVAGSQGLLGLFPVTAGASLGINALGGMTRKRTPHGNEILGQVLGYKQFLEKAEKSRIERLLADDPSYFYDTLPYAQVLRVTRQWARKFRGLSMEPPTWYVGTPGRHFHAMVFATSLDRSFRGATRAMATNPKTNSGGVGGLGGGFSGGGMGGGGGGSW